MLALANPTIKFPLNFPQHSCQETSLRGFAPIRVCYVHTMRIVTNENTDDDHIFCDIVRAGGPKEHTGFFSHSL